VNEQSTNEIIDDSINLVPTVILTENDDEQKSVIQVNESAASQVNQDTKPNEQSAIKLTTESAVLDKA